MKLVTSAQMRDLEAAAVAAGTSLDTLMANAGLAVAQEAWMQLGQVAERRIVVLVGPGNNGGDGLVAARHLAEWQAAVHCYALAARDDAQWQSTLDAGLPCTSTAEDDQDLATLTHWLAEAELVIDALLGTGRARPIEGRLAAVLERLQEARRRATPPKLIAVDLPTGIDADSGAADPLTVAVDETVVFECAKVGLYAQPGAALAGSVEVVPIGIPADACKALPYELLVQRQVKQLLPARPLDAHKGSFGRVLVVAGSRNYPGAALLAAAAAYQVGAGLVTLATPASLVPGLVTSTPEVTYLPLPEESEAGVIAMESLQHVTKALPAYDALVIGCGLGTAPATQAFVRNLLSHRSLAKLRGVIVDADALNALAGTQWSRAMAAPFVVTPHPGEMARLSQSTSHALQGERLACALRESARWQGTVVLKGANTIVADGQGRARISAAALPGLATAGTGDVLSGAIGGLLGQGLSPFDAAALAVYLHADAGERATKDRGSAGMTASDVLARLALAGRALAGEEPAAMGSLTLGGLPGLAAGPPP